MTADWYRKLVIHYDMVKLNNTSSGFKFLTLVHKLASIHPLAVSKEDIRYQGQLHCGATLAHHFSLYTNISHWGPIFKIKIDIYVGFLSNEISLYSLSTNAKILKLSSLKHYCMATT